jgi:hypothetical protein
MIKMAKQNMLPRRITKIITPMDKHQIKPPMCNDFCGAKETKRPWRGKCDKARLSHLKKAEDPGDIVSVDKLELSTPGFLIQILVAGTIFIDHAA